MTPEITICQEAWKLYDAWVKAFNARPLDQDKIHNAWREYFLHREDCPQCSQIQQVYDAG